MSLAIHSIKTNCLLTESLEVGSLHFLLTTLPLSTRCGVFLVVVQVDGMTFIFSRVMVLSSTRDRIGMYPESHTRHQLTTASSEEKKILCLGHRDGKKKGETIPRLSFDIIQILGAHGRNFSQGGPTPFKIAMAIRDRKTRMWVRYRKKIP